jgi:hypothetical protein
VADGEVEAIGAGDAELAGVEGPWLGAGVLTGLLALAITELKTNLLPSENFMHVFSTFRMTFFWLTTVHLVFVPAINFEGARTQPR